MPDILSQYVFSDDGQFAYERRDWEGVEGYWLTSQEWKGHVWEHALVVCRPRVQTGSTWLLHVTGSDPNAFDVTWSQGLADLAGQPVAILFHIPNQPIWDVTEDDLIAETFLRFIETGDATWPLLFPMVKSAVRAMDALEQVDGNALQFVVFGASKRGWTSWLMAATGDPRVAGIAPMLFDNLKMPLQLQKQREDWGEYSQMIEPYISRGLDRAVGTPRGGELVRLVDPASYLSRIEVPVMLIHGTNDPYWTVDALSLYWDDIAGPKYIVNVPNLHHAFEMTELWTPSLAAFMKLCDGTQFLPELGSEDRWSAQSESLRFDAAVWSTVSEPDASLFTAEFKSQTLSWENLLFTLSTPIRVSRPPRPR